MSTSSSDPERTKLLELLDNDGSPTSRQCAQALRDGVVAEPLKESAAIAQPCSGGRSKGGRPLVIGRGHSGGLVAHIRQLRTV